MSTRNWLLLFLALLLGTLFILWLLSRTPPVGPLPALDDEQRAALLARGRYLAAAAGCENCHTDREGGGPALAGGPAIDTPFGRFHAPNITPDPATGIGRWRETDFLRAMRYGVGPGGRHLYPVFPYTSYTGMTDTDLRALWVWLRSVPAVRRATPPHERPWWLARPLLVPWKALYLRPGPFRPDPARSAQWNRGAYLVQAVAHCGECHTPRDALGGLRRDRWLAGNPDGPEGEAVPNITPARRTGIGRWSEADLLDFFQTGMLPDGDYVGSVMADVVDYGLARLSEADRRAIVAYLKSLPPLGD